MYFNGYMRRGGCATCGVSNNNNLRTTYSPNFYNNRSPSPFTNDSSDDIPQNSLSQYNTRLQQRIMTPPRNFSYNRFNIDDNDYPNSNQNNYRNYYSPSRHTGCRNCAASSPKIFPENNFMRPSTGNYMRRNNNNLYDFNNNINYRNENEYQFRKNYENNNSGYQNDEEYNFRKRYENNNNDDNDIFENTFNYRNNRNNNLFENNFNNRNNNIRYLSPQRNMVNSFSSTNINRFSNNNNIYTRYNDYNNNGNGRMNNDNGNNIVETMLNNQYRSFLNNNINKYNYNNSNNNNYNSPPRRNYYSPSINHRRNYINENNQNNRNNFNNNNTNNNIYFNSRYRYLLPKDQDDINSSNDRFIMLNIYNYQRELKEIIQDRKTFFLCIYGTHDFTGKSWCSDCNIAMPNIEEAKNVIRNKKFEKEVYFLSLPIDKINMDYLRDDSIIQLERVPTLIYFDNGIEKNRMIENDLFNYQIVNNFILQPYEQYNYNPNKNRYLYQPRNYY